MTGPQGRVTVSDDEILLEIRDRVVRIEEQMKGLPDHESRIRALEQWKWGLLGVSGLLTTGFTFYASTKGA